MAELISSGVELMFLGMGIVYLFLIMLVFAINGMSLLVQRFFPENVSTITAPPVVINSTTNVEKNTIAAISAAVHQYRSKHH